MQLNQTLETSTFEIPEFLLNNPQTVLIKAYQNEELMNEIIKPTYHLPAQQQIPYFDPSPISKLTSQVSNFINPIQTSPYILASIGSLYAFSQTNSQTVEIRVNSEDKIHPLKIKLNDYIKLFPNQGIQQITFLSSSLLAVTSYDVILIFGILLNNSTRISVNFAFQLTENTFKKLTKQSAQLQPKSSLAHILSPPTAPKDLISASHDGKFLFVGSTQSKYVQVYSILQFVKIREFKLSGMPKSLDSNQNGSLIAACLKNEIQLIDVISGRSSYISNILPQVCCFYKATLFKQENITIPPIQELSFEEKVSGEGLLQQKYQTTMYQTMMSLQQQSNHRAMDYQQPEFEFISFASQNDVTVFIYVIQRANNGLQVSPTLAFDFSRQNNQIGGRISHISWCDGVLGAVCDGNIVLAATRENCDGVSGIVSGIIYDVGERAKCAVGRSIVVGGTKGVYCFDVIE